jgi:hypothetical protein
VATSVVADEADAPPEPSSPEGTGDRSFPRWAGWLLFAAFVGAATAYQAIRQTGHPLLDTMWAEDGHIFLTDALADHSPLVIVHPYAGYLHVVPRTIAFIVSFVPISDAALATRLLAALTVSLLGGYVFFASRELVPAAIGRGALAVLFVALPSAGVEVAGNSTNLHWYLFVACFFAVLHDPRSRGERVAGWVVMVGAVLSEGILLLLLPVVIYRFVKAKRWADRAFFIGFTALGLVHLLVIVVERNSYEFNNGPVLYDKLPGLYGMRVIAPLLIGERGTIRLVDHFGWGTGLKAAGLTVLALALLAAYVWFARRDLPHRGLLLVAMVYSGATFLAPTVGRGNTASIIPDADGYVAAGARYMLAPTLLLATVVIAIIAQRDPRVPTRVWLALQAVAVTGLAVIVVFNTRMATPASVANPWSVEVRHASEFCEITGAEAADIKVPPNELPFVVHLDCDELD